MDGNDENHLAAAKEYMQEMDERMTMWFDKMHGLYLKLSSVLISLSVATIGFAVSHLLEDGYHSGKYETGSALAALACQSFGIVLLLLSVFCGLTHLAKNLAFVQGTADHFAARYTEAVTMYYQKTAGTHTGQEEECRSPSHLWWYGQLYSFGFGIAFLIVWVAINFVFAGSSVG